MTRAIDITPEQRKLILGLLERYLPDTTAWAYGSRVKWTARPQSDLDMVVFSAPEQWLQVSDLRDAFEESNLPFRVDLFVWDDIPDNFKKNIQTEHVVLVEVEKSARPRGWQETTVGQFCPFHYGKSLPESRRLSGRYKVYGSNGPVGVHNEPLVPNQGVIIGRKGTAGAVHFSKDGFWPIDTTFYVSEHKNRDLRFTFYLLRSLGLEHMNEDSAVPGLNRETAHALRIQIPELPEQRAIARILGSLDDKIEHNRQMSETLEAMAQALFKSWFIDFDPVIDNALAAGNPIPAELKARAELRKSLGTTRKPLPANIRNLFPSEFHPTQEAGWIPKGWEVSSLDQIADYMNGLACQKYPAKDGEEGLPVIKIREMRSGIDERTDRATEEVPKKYIVEDGDILFSWSGSLVLRAWVEGRGLLNQHLFKVTSETYPEWFFYFWTQYHLDEFTRIAADKTTTMGHIKRSHLTSAKVIVPNGELLRQGNACISPLFHKHITALLERRSIAQLRNILLPKLVSGEIRVPETGILMEAGP